MNPGPTLCHTGRVLYSNVRGLHKNIRDLTVVSRSYDIIICAETLVSDYRHKAELKIPGFCQPLLVRRNPGNRRRGMAVYIRDGFSAHRKTNYECGCHEVMTLRICTRIHNFYILGAYRNPDCDDQIYDCLLTAMASIQSEDRKAVFVFVGDFNAHHREWLESVSPTDAHGRAAYDFASVSGCSQLVSGPTHHAGNCLDLVLTDVPDIVKAEVKAPIGTSDHSAISIKLDLRQPVPSYTITKEVYLKNRVNWNNVRDDVSRIQLGAILRSAEPMSAFNDQILSIIQRRVTVKRISYRFNDKAWFTVECKTARDAKQAAYRHWSHSRTRDSWNDYVQARSQAERTYHDAEREYLSSAKDKLLSATDPHKWWSTLKSVVFGSSPTLPPLLSENGQLITSPKEKADLLMKHFDSKLSREQLIFNEELAVIPTLNKIAFRSREVAKLLNALDPYGGTDPLKMFPLFFKETSAVIAKKLSAVFRRLMRSGSFPTCWRVAHITPIPKGTPSPDPSNYRPISITPILSKVFEHLVAARLSCFLERSGVLPCNQFAYRKKLGTTDALLTISHKIQLALDQGHETRIVQLDLSAAFDRVNHNGMLKKLRSIGVGGHILSILEQFLVGRTHRVCVDAHSSDWHPVHSGVPQGSVLGPLLFIIYTADLFSITKNVMYGYADDVTLLATIDSPHARSITSNSLNEDLQCISRWCHTWNMKLNIAKSKCMCISRSRSPFPQHEPLHVDGIALNDVDELDILGVKFDSKLTFESHIRSLVTAASQKLGIMRKAYATFNDPSVSATCFRSFILPALEYCAPVWSSAAASHLHLIDRVSHTASFLCGGNFKWNLAHRRKISSVCMLYKIQSNPHHSLYNSLPDRFVARRNTRQALARHPLCFQSIRCRTSQFQRCFLPSVVHLWNSFDEETCAANSIDAFKKKANKILSSS